MFCCNVYYYHGALCAVFSCILDAALVTVERGTIISYFVVNEVVLRTIRVYSFETLCAENKYQKLAIVNIENQINEF